MMLRPVRKLATAVVRSRADRIAVVRLEGIIGSAGPGRGGLTMELLEPTLRRAFETDRLTAIALSINSPGGSPTQSEYIAARIRQLAVENGVPVLAFCEELAASGGYWLACAADEIFVANTSVVGSIGVVSSGFGLSEVIERLGIQRRVYTAGENKHRLDIFEPEQPQDVEWLRAMQGEIHAAFIGWVRRRRAHKLRAQDSELFSGDVWVGRRAVDIGLADAVGLLRSVLAERYPDAEIDVIGTPKPLLARLFGSTAVSSAVESGIAGLISSARTHDLWARYGI